jgi:hypothetical protein
MELLKVVSRQQSVVCILQSKHLKQLSAKMTF